MLFALLAIAAVNTVSPARYAQTSRFVVGQSLSDSEPDALAVIDAARAYGINFASATTARASLARFRCGR